MKRFKCGKEMDREPNADCKSNYPVELCDRCKVGVDSALEDNKSRLEVIADDMDIPLILSKYGPEGCCELADELKRIAGKDYDDAMEWAGECNMDNKFNVSNIENDDSGRKEEYNCYAMFDNDKPMLVASGITKEEKFSIELKATKSPHIMEGNNGERIKVVAAIIFMSEEKKKFTLFLSNEDIGYINPKRNGETDEKI